MRRKPPNARNIGVVHPGTQHSWQTARALQDLGRLEWYATSIFYVVNRWPYKLISWLSGTARARVESEFLRFFHPALDPNLVHTFGLAQWAMRIAARLGFRRVAKTLMQANDRSIARPVGRLMAAKPVRAIWAYDLSALETFEAAKRRGIITILDRTIGHPATYNDVMSAVFDEFPEFFVDDNFRIPQNIIDRADREHALADVILVGSDFCRETLRPHLSLADYERKVKVLPYCFDDLLFGREDRPLRQITLPLRFLFVGQAGPRKGIHLLLKAFARIPATAASLTIVGDLQIPHRTAAQYLDRVEVVRTVARSGIPHWMNASDCLVFPSYFEGAALSVAEAYASGLGVIQSANTGMVLPNLSAPPLASLTVDAVYAAIMQAVEDVHVQNWRHIADECARPFAFERYRARVESFVTTI